MLPGEPALCTPLGISSSGHGDLCLGAASVLQPRQPGRGLPSSCCRLRPPLGPAQGPEEMTSPAGSSSNTTNCSPNPRPSLTTRKTPGGPELKDILPKTGRVQTLPPKHPSEGAVWGVSAPRSSWRGGSAPRGRRHRMCHPKDSADPGGGDPCPRHLLFQFLFDLRCCYNVVG